MLQDVQVVQLLPVPRPCLQTVPSCWHVEALTSSYRSELSGALAFQRTALQFPPKKTNPGGLAWHVSPAILAKWQPQ
eukprot:2351863-Amphidinium_carterae.1